jgi:hypothetical protein
MPLIDLKEAVDEPALKLPDALKPVFAAFADELVAKLKEALAGRTITITFE